MRAYVLVGCMLMLPTLAAAQEGPPPPIPAPGTDPTAQRHLGFYLHLDIGAGYLSASPSQPSGAPSLSGATLPFSIVIGGAVGEDWILAGDLWGVAGPSSSGSEWGATGFGAVGLNVTRYFMPANVFVSLSPSITGLLIHLGQGFADRKSAGFGAKLAVGKEWWVGDHWWLGVAAQGFFAFNEGQGSSSGTSWPIVGGGFVFSVTVN